MWLFVRHYNRYLKRNKLKYSDKGLINFKNTHPPTRKHKKEDDDIPCYECGKSGYYRTNCPSLIKHHKKKDKKFYKTKDKNAKDRRAYIVWEKEDESFSSDSCSSSDDIFINLCLMERKKSEDSQVYSFDLVNDPSYREILNAFYEMYADSLNVFKNLIESSWVVLGKR